MDVVNPQRSDVRRKAEDKFAKVVRRDAEVRAFQQQRWDAEAVKIARLRALRLAHEAEGAAPPAADLEAAPPAKRAKRPRSTTATAG